MKLKNARRYDNINLTADGTLKDVGCDEWYYATPARQILNGSLSAPNVPATSIRFDKLVSIVTDRLAKTFEPVKKESVRV
jgi:hypothetical protein